MKPDITAVVRELLDQCFIDWRVNVTFLDLIPKRDGEKCISNYRLISPLQGVYKIMAKALTMRLIPVMNELISEVQTAAVRGRQIHDEILIANEIIDSTLRRKESGLLLKLDFFKAFDSVFLWFLDYMLMRMGFGLR